MRQLYPHPAHRPAARVNTIASADGASSAGGLSGALGGPADEAFFAPIDELCRTVSPTLLDGDARRLVGEAMHRPVPLSLAHVAEDDDFLFLHDRRRP